MVNIKLAVIISVINICLTLYLCMLISYDKLSDTMINFFVYYYMFKSGVFIGILIMNLNKNKQQQYE